MIPYWLKGGLTALVYVIVLLAIKTTCVPDWCFADIFLPIIWWPLSIFDYFLSEKQIIFLGKNLIKTTLIFWFVIGSSLGLMHGLWKRKYQHTNEYESANDCE